MPFRFPSIRGGGEIQENFSPNFRAAINAHYGASPEAEAVFGYLYAVMHSPSYRHRYSEFLKRDFPRIPLVPDMKDFNALAKLGWQLCEIHLLKKPLRGELGQYHGKGDHRVQKPVYSWEQKTLHINKDQYFAPVPEAVWNFHIGGYPVLEKYLKSRKDRPLSLDEISHIAVICDVLAFTIEQMQAIDALWLQAFPDRG